jgi:hypothetical protein
MKTCQIQWIDRITGKATPDNNPAIQLVRTVDRVQQINGVGVKFSASQWFPICAEHSKRLNDPGMHIWECADLTE